MNTNTHMYKAGDIVLCRFHPSIGSELKRYRPVVVISEKVAIIDSRFVLIAPLTTRIHKKKNVFEMKVEHDELDKKSAILLWYLRTVDVSRVEKKLGALSDGDVQKMLGKVRVLF